MNNNIILTFIFIFFTNFCFAGLSIGGSLTHRKIVEPGDKFGGVISLSNVGKRPVDAKVYQKDYIFFADGKRVYGEPGSSSRSNAKWFSIKPDRIIIPPHETVTIYYNGEVPNSPALRGSYWSMIKAEEIPESSPESSQNQKKELAVGITNVFSYGIQIITNIGDSGECKIKFLDKKLIKENDGKRIFQIDMENIGEKMLSPGVWMELFDKDGASIGRFESPKRRIYPGCSVRHKIDITKVSSGSYKSLLIADNGDENVFGAQYQLDIE